MKKVIPVIMILVLSLGILAGCSSTPTHLLMTPAVYLGENGEYGTEIAYYDVYETLRDKTEVEDDIINEGEAYMKLELVKPDADGKVNITYGEQGETTSRQYGYAVWVLRFNMTMKGYGDQNGKDFVDACIGYNALGQPLFGYQKMEKTFYRDNENKLIIDPETGEPQPQKIQTLYVNALYTDDGKKKNTKHYSYEAKSALEILKDGKVVDVEEEKVYEEEISKEDSFKLGVFRSSPYFNNFMEYQIMRSFDSLSSKAQLGVSYRIPDWQTGKPVSFTARSSKQLGMYDVLDIPAKPVKPDDVEEEDWVDDVVPMACVPVFFTKAGKGKNTGKPREVYYARTNILEEVEEPAEGETPKVPGYDFSRGVLVDQVNFTDKNDPFKYEVLSGAEQVEVKNIILKIVEGGGFKDNPEGSSQGYLIYRLKSYGVQVN